MSEALTLLSRSAVRHRVATGRWQQPHRSVLVTHNGPVTRAEHRWIAVLAAGDHAVLAGVSAAEVGGLRGYGDDKIHLLVPAGHRVETLTPDVVVHRTTRLDAADVLVSHRVPRTRMARSIVDAAQWAATDDLAQAVVAAAFQQRLVAIRSMEEVLRRLVRARRRQLILRTARDAAGGAHSLAEIDLGRLCRRHGLPAPARQVVRQDAAGRRRYLDAYFEQWRVHVEIDGSQHFDPRHAWADMQRQNDLWITGDRVLRFPAWALRRTPDAVASQLRAALRAAGWRP
jgi:very-short-patch-repair endonuclease